MGRESNDLWRPPFHKEVVVYLTARIPLSQHSEIKTFVIEIQATLRVVDRWDSLFLTSFLLSPAPQHLSVLFCGTN